MEWFDKADHYFSMYEIPREDRLTIASFYLDGRANKWWRWIKKQYERDNRYFGWDKFEDEFMKQWGPSPITNHHGQLAKIKWDGKVKTFINEF